MSSMSTRRVGKGKRKQPSTSSSSVRQRKTTERVEQSQTSTREVVGAFVDDDFVDDDFEQNEGMDDEASPSNAREAPHGTSSR